MRLKLVRRSARQRALVDAAVTAYAQWRSECAWVRAAYRRWVAAGAGDNVFAFDAYNDALDREEHAAHRYARLISRAGEMPEAAVLHQLAGIEIGLRAG
jgi:hypothetical protein